MAINWEKVKSKLNEFIHLEDNWDSYGAKSINPEICDLAYRLLQQISRCDTSTPSIAPCADGSIQFEWNKKEINLEVQVSLNSIDVLYTKEDKEEGFEVSFDKAVSKLCRIIDECGDKI